VLIAATKMRIALIALLAFVGSSVYAAEPDPRLQKIVEERKAKEREIDDARNLQGYWTIRVRELVEQRQQLLRLEQAAEKSQREPPSAKGKEEGRKKESDPAD
jgi:hypothetical protein